MPEGANESPIKNTGFDLRPLHQQRPVVKHLAREKTKRELVLVPSQFRAILHRLHSRGTACSVRPGIR